MAKNKNEYFSDWPEVIRRTEESTGIPATQVNEVFTAVTDTVHKITSESCKEATDVGAIVQIATPLAIMTFERVEEERVDTESGERYMTDPYMRASVHMIETLVERANEGIVLGKLPVNAKAEAKAS